MADATVLNVMLACASACWHECASQLLQNITATHMTVSDRLRPRLITINRPVERGAVTGGPNLDNGGRGGASRQAKTPSNGLLRPFHSSLTPGICVFVSTRCGRSGISETRREGERHPILVQRSCYTTRGDEAKPLTTVRFGGRRPQPLITGD